VRTAEVEQFSLAERCLDVARWYRPGYRLTPQQLGDFNAVAALRIAGARTAA
jgi:hypothetical protein